MVNDFEKIAPISKDEIFQYVSGHCLTYSGPFILKILQTIRPFLTRELALKYNLTKLTYPVLTRKQVEIILSHVVEDINMIEIVANKSASVGHVCIANKVNKPEEVFVIKIIKPISISQSCWEYKTLHKIFPEGSCEREYVVSVLKSNGSEMSVLNEIDNINKGNKYYECDYNGIFGIDNGVKLSTVKVVDGITRKGAWYAFTMSLAEGIPVGDLVEKEDMIPNDTKYRSILHRCADLLVYKFFYNLINNGFYHGDLHAGNIFYSCKNKKLTMIDFGAVGKINLFENDDSMKAILEVIIMSIFHNYVGVLDRMTILMNSKCTETSINMSTPEYIKLSEELRIIGESNKKLQQEEEKRMQQYNNDLFGEKRLKDEELMVEETEITKDGIRYDSIYSYLEYKRKDKDTIVEQRDVLPDFTKIDGSNMVTFTEILGKITEFYALQKMNIATKFSDYYDLQKAYALLLGVLHKMHYNTYRLGIVMKKAIANYDSALKMIGNPSMGWHIWQIYSREKSKN